jgi:UDP-2,3-diacylglucosamine hydrolase
MNGYFEQELNIPVFHQPQKYLFNGQRCLIGHGDGLGPGDYGYKLLKKIFRNPMAQFLFGILPPVIGLSLAQVSSKGSRAATGRKDEEYLGDDNEWLVRFCKEEVQREHQDYFIFGHRHLPIDMEVGSQSRYINLGDWLNYCTFMEFDGSSALLKKWTPEGDVVL